MFCRAIIMFIRSLRRQCSGTSICTSKEKCDFLYYTCQIDESQQENAENRCLWRFSRKESDSIFEVWIKRTKKSPFFAWERLFLFFIQHMRKKMPFKKRKFALDKREGILYFSCNRKTNRYDDREKILSGSSRELPDGARQCGREGCHWPSSISAETLV